MAKSKIPDPLTRRHLIEKAMAEAQSLRLAEAYLEEGRDYEAIEFLLKADARDHLVRLRTAAVAAGDAFMLRAAANALEEPPHRAEWLSLAKAAEAAGRDRCAAEATRQADRRDD